MLSFPQSIRIYLALDPVDMRKSHHGLAAVVRDHLGLDPLSGHLVFFVNKRRNLAKVLWFDRTGLALFYNHRGSYCVSYDSINHLDSPARLLAGHAIG